MYCRLFWANINLRGFSSLAAALFILLLGCYCSPQAVAAQEEILSFHSVIEVRKDSSLNVTETISVRAAGQQIKRGIFRDFPTDIRSKNKTYKVAFRVKKVLRDGKIENYRVENIAGGKRVRIGSSDVFLKHGVHTYTIEYVTKKQLGFFDNHDELFWNVTGDRWAFSIRKASAKVILPEPIQKEDLQISGYTGPYGSREQKFTSRIEADGSISFESASWLPKGHGLSIVVGWPKGIVPEPVPERIHGFRSDITIRKDGTLDVVERFRADLFQELQRGDFVRTLPWVVEKIGPLDRLAELKNLTALQNGQLIPVETESFASEWKIRYGLSSSRSETRDYELRYSLGPLHVEAGGEVEVVWNAIGTGFRVPVNGVEVTVRFEDGKGAIKGVSALELSGARFVQQGEGEFKLSWSKVWGARRAFPVRIVLASDAIEKVGVGEKFAKLRRDNPAVEQAALWFLLLCIYYVVTWFFVGRDGTRKTVVPRWDLPESISPAGVRFISEMGFDNRAFAAAMVSLAVQDRVHLNRDGDGHYVIELREAKGRAEFRDENTLLSNLFSRRSSNHLVVIQSNRKVIRKSVEALKKALCKEHLKRHFRKNSIFLFPGWLLSLYGMWRTLAVMSIEGMFGTVVLAVIGFPFLRAAIRAFANARRGRSGIIATIGRLFSLISALFVFVGITVLLISLSSFVSLVPAFIVLHIFINYLFYHLIKAPTLRGQRLQEHFAGIKMYIESAEAETVEAVDEKTGELPPRLSPEVFEKFLPYAVALGIEKKWTDKFIAEYSSEVLQGISENRYDYRWFSGNDDSYVSSFGDSFSTEISSASLPPRVSSSGSRGGGFSSGFGGGGFSGGGGGGGGGGGW